MLETFLLAGHDFHDIQNFAPAPDGCEPHGLFYLRQAHSIANQLDKPRVLDECWGAGGHDSTPADWSRIGRWLIVHGVNLLNPHLSLLTIRGTRKTDHPQTFPTTAPGTSTCARSTTRPAGCAGPPTGAGSSSGSSSSTP